MDLSPGLPDIQFFLRCAAARRIDLRRCLLSREEGDLELGMRIKLKKPRQSRQPSVHRDSKTMRRARLNRKSRMVAYG